jgi:hypothetical protein
MLAFGRWMLKNKGLKVQGSRFKVNGGKINPIPCTFHLIPMHPVLMMTDFELLTPET